MYAGADAFVDEITRFATDALDADEPILIMVEPAKIAMLRDTLHGTEAGVQFADMADVGANPARIIPAWRQFCLEHADRPGRLRGVGEPIWSARDPHALVESQHHEALLNVAIEPDTDMWLVCPYDAGALDPAVIDEAYHSHPLVTHDVTNGTPQRSDRYRDASAVRTVTLGAALPEPPGTPEEFVFDMSTLRVVRTRVTQAAARAGLGEGRTCELALAVGEIATNSLRCGGGSGTMRTWTADGAIVCEISDAGEITEPLVGRQRATPGQEGGHGLWLANQLCDLVQIRSSEAGTTIRTHMRVAASSSTSTS